MSWNHLKIVVWVASSPTVPSDYPEAEESQAKVPQLVTKFKHARLGFWKLN